MATGVHEGTDSGRRGGFPRQACCCFSWLRGRRAAEAILLPPSRCRWILPLPYVAMPANSAIDDAPADAPAWDTAGDCGPQPLKEADSFQSVFYNEAGDIVNYDPNLQVASRACMHLAGPSARELPLRCPQARFCRC